MNSYNELLIEMAEAEAPLMSPKLDLVDEALQARPHPACKPRGDNSRRFQDFYLRAKATLWSWLSYMYQIRS